MTRPRSTKSATAQADAITGGVAEQWWASLTSRERHSWTERLAARRLDATPDAAMALYGVDSYWQAVRRLHARMGLRQA